MSEEEVDEQFLKEHLVIIDTHLKLLEQAITKFQCAYNALTTTQFDTDNPQDRDKIWNSLEQLSHSCWSIGQTIDPNISGPKKEKSKDIKKEYQDFLRKRGEQLRALLSLELSNKSSLNGLRNSWVHVDERLDEWYFRLRCKNQKPAKIKYRSLANGREPDCDEEIANLFWFDYNSGEIYNLGEEKPHNLRGLSAAITLVNDGLRRADNFLQERFPKRTPIISETP